MWWLGNDDANCYVFFSMTRLRSESQRLVGNLGDWKHFNGVDLMSVLF